MMEQVGISTPFIRLDAFLKLCRAVETGGHAKVMIQSGEVAVNGETCLMRGKKLTPGSQVQIKGDQTVYEVTAG